jgi:hypothetical protein
MRILNSLAHPSTTCSTSHKTCITYPKSPHGNDTKTKQRNPHNKEKRKEKASHMQAMHSHVSHVSHHLSCMTSSKQEAAPATAAGWLVEGNQSSARKPTLQAIVDNIVGSQSERQKDN